MEKYFAELNELSSEARNALAAGKSELSNGIKPRIALAMYGDMDAVFSCFLEETSTRHLKFETKKLEKLYKKLHKRIQKMDKADNVYKAKKCFSEEELQIPYTSYKLALFCLQCNRPDWYLQHMQTAAAGGDPFAIYYCQSYYSTNSAEANPYGKNATTVKLNGAFDFDRMLYYAIRGIGITSSAYYPNVPYISFYCICNHTDVMRKDTLERLYKTLTYFALPENIGTEEYKEHFGDFVPSPLQVKIARKWFFVDGDRLGLSSEMLTKRKLLRNQIAAAIEAEAAPQAAAKAKKETAMPKTSKTEDKKAAAPAVTIISETYASGNRYEGEALNGVRHGQGEYIFANGNRYKGAFENGKFNGYGVYTSAKGWKYEGEFRDDEFNGIGTYYWTDGDVYTGEFRNDAPNGKGKYLHADGCIYEGDFCNWKRHGKGAFTYKSGRKDISLWEDGKEALCLESHRPNSDMPQPTLAFSKNAKHIDYESGAFYDGDVVNGVPHGQGVYHEPNGDFYQGAFANGVRHGQGMSYSSTEVSDRGKKRTVLWVTHDGGWKNGKKHGHGVTVNRNRYVLRGDQWVYTELVTTEGDWVDGNVPGKYCVRTDVDSGSGLVRGTTNWYYYKDGNVEKIDNLGGGFGIDESFERKRQEVAANDQYDEKLYRELFRLKQDGKAYLPRFANLSAQLHSKENIEAIVSKIMRQNDMSKVSIEDASFVLFLYNKFVKQGANTQYMAWCHYRLGDYKKAAGRLINEAMAYSYLKKAERKREIWQICLNRNSRNADYYKELAIDRIGHARAELEAAKKTPMRYQADSIREQIEDVELQLGMW